MRTLWQRVELVDLYQNQMQEFDNLKMEYAFMKVDDALPSHGVKHT
jgi:hypothetical protein